MADNVDNAVPNVINVNNNLRNPMPNNIMNVRDRLFHAIYFKAAYLYSQVIPRPLRTILEYIILIKALLFFFTLVYIHVKFIKHPATCLQHAQDWPRDGVLRVEVIPNLERRKALIYQALENRMNLEFARQQYYSMSIEGPFTKDFQRVYNKFEHKLEQQNLYPYNETYKRLFVKELLLQADEHKLRIKDEEEDLKLFADTSDGEIYIVEYSLEYGYLRLTQAARKRLNIPVRTIKLDPMTNKCFGDRVSRFLLREMLGYDDILMASVRTIAEKEDNKGYLRNVITGEHYRFVSMWWVTWSSYPVAFFVMLLFTFSISMLLRFSHNQIFVFIVDLLQMLEFNISARFPIAPILTIILALVGMEAIMSEFFNDATTAFYIILIVWAADQFDAICCHTSITKRHWLRFFYLYHFAFYAYHYRFSGQNRSLALVASWLFIQHSMLFFFHRYELPVIIQQTQLYLVTANRINPAAAAAERFGNRVRRTRMLRFLRQTPRPATPAAEGVAGDDANRPNANIMANRSIVSQLLHRHLYQPHFIGLPVNDRWNALRQALYARGWIRPLVHVRVQVGSLQRINLDSIQISPTANGAPSQQTTPTTTNTSAENGTQAPDSTSTREPSQTTTMTGDGDAAIAALRAAASTSSRTTTVFSEDVPYIIRVPTTIRTDSSSGSTATENASENNLLRQESDKQNKASNTNEQHQHQQQQQQQPQQLLKDWQLSVERILQPEPQEQQIKDVLEDQQQPQHLHQLQENQTTNLITQKQKEVIPEATLIEAQEVQEAKEAKETTTEFVSRETSQAEASSSLAPAPAPSESPLTLPSASALASLSHLTEESK